MPHCLPLECSGVESLYSLWTVLTSTCAEYNLCMIFKGRMVYPVSKAGASLVHEHTRQGFCTKDSVEN